MTAPTDREHLAYLAAYDSDDQDRTPSDFTTVRLQRDHIALLEDTLKARTDALGRVAETNQQLRDEIHDRESSEQDVRARLKDAAQERDELRADLDYLRSTFPCDKGCFEAPEEDCSRHGRKPAELWRIIAEVQQQRDELRAKVEALVAEWERCHFTATRELSLDEYCGHWFRKPLRAVLEGGR